MPDYRVVQDGQGVCAGGTLRGLAGEGTAAASARTVMQSDVRTSNPEAGKECRPAPDG